MCDSIKTKFVGLDVHKDTIVIAVAELGRHPAQLIATVPHEWKALRKVLDKLGPSSSVHCCYEAGPLAASQLRHAHAPARRGHPHHPDLARAFEPAIHGDIHPPDGTVAGPTPQTAMPD